MATNTYVALDKKTVTSAVASIEFTGISSAYTDLVIVSSYNLNADDLPYIVVGTGGTIDTGSNYSFTYMRGSGTSVTSGRSSNNTRIYCAYSAVGWSNFRVDLMNYSNSSTYKTILTRGNDATNNGVLTYAGLWRNSGAINTLSIRVDGSNFQVGSTFSLYGIKAETANLPDTARATGGTITYTNTDVIHTFTSSGTFTPSVALTCDYLVVAGGGAGGAGGGGGGGAGGYLTSTGLALSSAQTITIGAGGAPAGTTSSGGSGSNSVLGSITATGGGGGGGRGGTSPGTNGGSGGGEGCSITGKGLASPTGQGNNGGAFGGGSDSGGGGGGATAVGQTSANYGGFGGAGALNVIGGTGVTYAGGGGGGSSNTSTAGAGGAGGGGNGGNSAGTGLTSGTANTGGGGGGGGTASQGGGTGGSGIVIIRYPKA